MTVSSYHARPIASTEFRFNPGGTVPCLSHPRALSCPVPASLKSLLFPRFLFSKALCLLAAGAGTGGGFRLSESFQTLTCTVSLHRLHRCRRGGPLEGIGLLATSFLTFNECAACGILVEFCHLLSSRLAGEGPVSPWGDVSGWRAWL